MRTKSPLLAALLALAALALPARAQAAFADGAPGKPDDAKKSEAKPDAKDEKKDDKKKDEKKDRWLAVLHGDVHTITDGVLRDATLLCKNGRIHAIGPGLDVPKEAATIDATGLRVYPGLIAVNSAGILGLEPLDYTTDVFSYNMTFALACGWTTLVSGNSAGKCTWGTLEGLLLRPNLWMRMGYASGDERRRVRADLDAARDYRRKRRQWELDRATNPQAEEPKPEGVSQELLRLLAGDVTARFDAFTAEDLRAIAKLVTEYGFKAVVFGANEGWIVADELGRAGISCVITPHTPRTPRDARLNADNGSTIENAAILWQHGVKVAVIPSGSRLSSDGLLDRDLRTPTVEAALAVRGGLPHDAAEAALTINAARILGVDDRVGSLEPGKDADFILVDGDLLDYQAFVRYAVVNGRLAYDKAKESLFRDLRPAPSTYAEPKPPEPPKPAEEKKDEKKEGDKPKEGETPADGAKPAEGEKKDGEKPKEGDKPKEEPKPGEPPKGDPKPVDPPKEPKPEEKPVEKPHGGAR